MTSLKFTPFEEALIRRTYELRDKIFEREETFPAELFHYTSSINADRITQSQQIKMSFIRSTSDPLELSMNLVYCRDWLCLPEDNSGREIPKVLFDHFSAEASDPLMRPYFFSMSESSQDLFLRNNYGDSIVKISPVSEDPAANLFFRRSCMLIKCRYENDIKGFIGAQLDRWSIEALNPTLSDFGFKDHTQNVLEWHFLMMEMCFILSLGVKSKAYSRENEKRLILIPGNPDRSNGFYSKRALHPSANKFARQREYITLNLAKCGLKATKLE